MESVTIIFSMFRLVFVEILSYGVRYTLIIAKMCSVAAAFCYLPLYLLIVTGASAITVRQGKLKWRKNCSEDLRSAMRTPSSRASK